MMKQPNRSFHARGAALVLLVFLIPVVLAIAAFSINLVYIELTRTELQISTDVATRAAGRVLAVTGDQSKAIEAAQKFANANRVGRQIVQVGPADVVFGVSTRLFEDERYAFNTGKNPNAVRLELTQLDAKSGRGLPMLFPTMGIPIEFRPIKTAISTATELDLAIVLDRSGSMAFSTEEIAGSHNPAAAPLGWQYGDPIPPNARWLDTVGAIDSFIKLLLSSHQVERVSLSTYADKSSTDVKLTNDYSLIFDALNARSNAFNGGRTNVGAGILEGVSALSDKRLARPWATRVLIVMTDGIHNTGTDPITAAHLAANEKIMIFTLSFSKEANQSQMKEIATIGAGMHFHATTGGELSDAFKAISKNLPTLITF